MKQNFTPNDLLRYVYKEMTVEEEKSIEQQLATDSVLALEFNELLDGISLLQNAEINPSQSLIQDLKSKLHRNIQQPSV